jgi:uncharacterized membrane protein
MERRMPPDPTALIQGKPAVLPQPIAAKPRLESLDLLRGLAMVLMALDHVRDFFSGALHSPTDVDHAGVALFFTRWFTHDCAPVFVALAGTGAYLSARRGKSRRQLARSLVTRGLWLVLLELTVLHFAMTFNLNYHWVPLTILWAIGWSMIALAALIWLPTPVVAAIGVAILLGHNLLDGVRVDRPGVLHYLFTILHGPPRTFHTRTGVSVRVLYPLLPWVGVMASGYAFGWW